MKKTLEAQGDPFRRGLPTLQTSLTHPELPPCPRRLRSENLFRISGAAGDMGEVLGLDGRWFLDGVASRPFSGRYAFGIMPCTSAEIPPVGAPSGFDGTPQAFALK